MAHARESSRDEPARNSADFTGENASRTAEKARNLFGDVSDAVKNQARGVAEEQKTVGAERIGSLGKAMHNAADELGREVPGAAGYIHSAADRLETASSALRERDVDELVNGVSAFMRRQPATTFAGAVLAGFALSRFLKSSGR